MKNLVHSVGIVCLLILTAATVEGQSLYWDLNGTAAGAGSATPSGTWDSATANWSADTAGAGATQSWSSGATAVFSAGTDATGAYTVTIGSGSTQTWGGLTVEDGTTVTITNANAATTAFNLTGTASVDVASGKTLQVNSPIGGTGGLVKNGVGTLTLQSNNTYNGNTTINAGVVTLNTTSATFGNASGTVYLSGGRLHSAADRQSSTVYSPVKNSFVLTADSIISGAGLIDLLLDGSITGTGGTLIVSNTSSSSSTFNLQLNGGGYEFTRPIFLTNNGSGATRLDLEASNTSPPQVISGVISGSGLVRRTCWNGGEGGVSVLNAQNTYTNTSQCNGGFLAFGVDSVGVHPSVVSGPIGTNTLTINDDTVVGLMAWNGPRTIGNKLIFGGVLNCQIGQTNNLTFSGPIDLGTTARTITVTNANVSLIFAGVVNNTAALAKAGPGRLIFQNANSHSGLFTNSAGTTLINNISGSGLGTANAINASGATFGGSGTMTGGITNNGTISPGNDGIGTLTAGAAKFNGNSRFKFEISSVVASEGVNQDFLNLTSGALALSGTIYIDIVGVNLADFDNTQNYTWRIAHAPSGSGSPTFNITATGLPSLGTGSFKARRVGGDLYLDFGRAPTIVSSTISTTVDPGDAINMTVTATGSLLTYQWKTNGANITGATTSAYTIPAATGANDASYSVVVTNAWGSDSNSGYVGVRAKILADAPATLTAIPGEVKSISVTADGGHIVYQWYKDGVALPGQTGSSITFNPIRGTDSAISPGYYVVITNSLNSVTSGTTAVQVAPDLLLSLPTTTTVPPGGDESFAVAVTGTMPLTMWWTKDGTNITDDSHFEGTSTPNLTIHNVSAADAGSYQVTITNTAGLTNSIMALVVNPEATINQQPVSTTNTAGVTATFSVGAKGQPVLKYQWQANGVDLADVTDKISGATGSMLTIINPQQSDAVYTNGAMEVLPIDYSVIVSNDINSVTSSIVHLTVIDPINVISAPTNLTVVSNSPAVFTVEVAGTSPQYQWKRNGTNLVEGTKYSGVTSSSLTIAATRRSSDNDTYSVSVTNLANSTNLSATLTVIDPVVITSQPQSVTKGLGSNVTFSVSAIGTTPSYQWRKDGSNLDGQTGTAVTINSVSHSDAGTYSVVVSNFAGAVVSSNAVLTVQDAPVFTTTLTDASNYVHTAANFTGTVSGQSLTYIWKKGTTTLTDAVKYTGLGTSSLTINDVTLSDAGTYSLTATNYAGQATSQAALIVGAPASISTAFGSTYSVRDGDDAAFSATATGSPAPAYQWYYNELPISAGTTSSYTVASVNPSKYGYYKCVASNEFGTAAITIELNGLYTVKWEIIGDASGYVQTNGDMRSLAVLPNGNILVPDKSPTEVKQFSGADGSHMSSLNVSGISGGTYTLNRIAVADDGVIYACNLETAGKLKMYRWGDVSSVPTVAYDGTSSSPTTQRLGDVMALRGSGTSTEVLVGGSGTSTALVYLKTADGTNFTASVLTTTPAMSGDFYNGLFFSSGNSFYTKTYNTDKVRKWNFDPVASTATLVGQMNPTIVETPMVGVGITSDNLLYGFNRTTARLLVLDASNTNDLRALVSYSFASTRTENAASWGGAGQSVKTPDGFAAMRPDSGLMAVRKLAAPEITVQPAPSTAANAGTTVNLSVGMNTPVLAAQWFKDGMPLAGKTSATLSLADIRKADAGTYKVIAVSAAGALTSSDAVVTVADPAINTKPTSIVDVPAGSTTNFTVGAAGTGLTYLWQKKNGELFEDITSPRAGGMTTATLTFAGVLLADAGTYRVTVTGTGVDAPVNSEEVTLTVVKADGVVTTWPSASPIIYGQTLTASSLTGGVATPEGTFEFATPSIQPDAGTAPQTVTYTPTDIINYNAITSTVPVTVSKADQTIDFAVIGPKHVGDVFTITATATSGLPVSLADVSTLPSPIRLVGNQVTATNTGTASIQATQAGDPNHNPATPVTRTFTITIAPPVITWPTGPSSQFAYLGSNLVLSVTATGPDLTYQWSTNGIAIPNATAASFSKKAALTDAGVYTCEVANGGGRVTSAPITVAVGSHIKVVTKPAPLTKFPGQSALFSVKADNVNAYQWQLAGNNVAGVIGTSYTIPVVPVNALPGDSNYVVGVVLSNAISQEVVVTNTTLTVKADTNIPVVKVVFPAANAAVPANNSNIVAAYTLRLSGTVTDNARASEVWYTLNGGAPTSALLVGTNPASMSWISTNGGLVLGTNVLRAYARDFSGLYSATQTVTFVYDHPNTVVITKLYNGQLNSDPTIGVVVNANKGLLVGGVPSNTELFIGRTYKLTATELLKPGIVISNWMGRWYDNNGIEHNEQLMSNKTSMSFVMATNMEITVNYITNPFVIHGGTYEGLCWNTNGTVDPQSAGFATMKLAPLAVSGKLSIDGDMVPFALKLGIDGKASDTVVNRTNKLGKPNLVIRNFECLWGADAIHCFIELPGVFTSELVANRMPWSKTNLASAYANSYTFVLPGTENLAQGPMNKSYGTIIVSTNGKVTIAGITADGHPLKQTTTVSQSGEIPLFAQLYLTTNTVTLPTGPAAVKEFQGILLGTLFLQPNNLATLVTNGVLTAMNMAPQGPVIWVKPVLNPPQPKYSFANGFYHEAEIIGSRHLAPLVGATTAMFGNRMYYFNDATITADGAGIVATTNNVYLTIAPTNKFLICGFTNSVPSSLVKPMNKMAVALTSKTGGFTGAFTNANVTAPTIKFGGIMLQDWNVGYGWFQNPTAFNFGDVTITPRD